MHKLYKLTSTDERDKAIRFLLDRNYNFITRKFCYPENTDCICIDFTNQLLSFRLFTKETKHGYEQMKQDVSKYEIMIKIRSSYIEKEIHVLMDQKKEYEDWNSQSRTDLTQYVNNDRSFLETLRNNDNQYIRDKLQRWIDHHDVQRFRIEEYRI